MPINLSSVVSFSLTYLNVGLSVLGVEPRDNKPVKHFKWNSFQYTLPAQEQVNSLLRGTDVNVAIATGATSRIHRHNMAQQLPWSEKGEWP